MRERCFSCPNVHSNPELTYLIAGDQKRKSQLENLRFKENVTAIAMGDITVAHEPEDVDFM